MTLLSWKTTFAASFVFMAAGCSTGNIPRRELPAELWRLRPADGVLHAKRNGKEYSMPIASGDGLYCMPRDNLVDLLAELRRLRDAEQLP